MNKIILFLILISATLIASTSTTLAIPIFPGAEGFGTETRAAYGDSTNPAIYLVTNLDDDGIGSLRACVEASEPRICVFEISGVISLSSDLRISEPYLTIAGQTAPSPGIMIRNYGIRISTHDVLLQHIAVRVGDDGRTATGAWDNLDCIQINTGGYNVVIDHCSFTWGIDEVASVWGSGIHDVTWSNNIISEGLQNSVHTEGEHSKGLLIGADPGQTAPKNMTIIKTLFASNKDRNPQIKGGTTSVVANNIIYNCNTPWEHSNYVTNYIYEPIISSCIGVTIKDGPDTVVATTGIKIGSTVVSGSQVYQTDNLRPAYPSYTFSDKAGVTVSSPPISFSPHTILPREEGYDYVLANVGSRPASRDSTDSRIINEVATGTGNVKDHSSGLWPIYSTVSSTFTVPNDPHGDLDGDGYTNLEEALHYDLCQVEGPDSPSCTSAPSSGLEQLMANIELWKSGNIHIGEIIDYISIWKAQS